MAAKFTEDLLLQESKTKNNNNANQTETISYLNDFESFLLDFAEPQVNLRMEHSKIFMNAINNIHKRKKRADTESIYEEVLKHFENRLEKLHVSEFLNLLVSKNLLSCSIKNGKESYKLLIVPETKLEPDLCIINHKKVKTLESEIKILNYELKNLKSSEISLSILKDETLFLKEELSEFRKIIAVLIDKLEVKSTVTDLKLNQNLIFLNDFDFNSPLNQNSINSPKAETINAFRQQEYSIKIIDSKSKEIKDRLNNDLADVRRQLNIKYLNFKKYNIPELAVSSNSNNNKTMRNSINNFENVTNQLVSVRKNYQSDFLKYKNLSSNGVVSTSSSLTTKAVGNVKNTKNQIKKANNVTKIINPRNYRLS
ncbi:homeobox protein 9-like [Hydra vulgaris]|uniref:Homeobox protein 9-like n=1 Tax=Hydra vulgaris TaxID=6087 RepID=A0ABM4DLT7_HYDVU